MAILENVVYPAKTQTPKQEMEFGNVLARTELAVAVW